MREIKKLLVVGLLAIALPNYGQFSFGLNVDAGVAAVGYNKYDSDLYHGDQYSPAISGQIGFWIKHQLSDRIALSYGINFNQVEERYSNTFQLEDQFCPGLYTYCTQLFIERFNYTSSHISYLNIPILALIKTKYFDVNIGVKMVGILNQSAHSIIYYSQTESVGFQNLGKDSPSSRELYNPRIGMNEFDYGLLVGVNKQLSDKVFLNAQFYTGFVNAFEPEHFSKLGKTYQLKVGIAYQLFSTSKSIE
jgi:hypothetical protein